MQLVTGDLWAELGQAALLLVTTNSTTRQSDGTLIMGRGAAAEAKKRYPFLPRVLGHQLRMRGLVGGQYGVLPGVVDPDYNTRIGAFQTKVHWATPADLDLIAYSIERLCRVAEQTTLFPRIALNFPGIGNGSLDQLAVAPLLECLPHSVIVYQKEQR